MGRVAVHRKSYRRSAHRLDREEQELGEALERRPPWCRHVPVAADSHAPAAHLSEGEAAAGRRDLAPGAVAVEGGTRKDALDEGAVVIGGLLAHREARDENVSSGLEILAAEAVEAARPYLHRVGGPPIGRRSLGGD